MREVRAKRQNIYGLCAVILLALSPNLVRAQTELVVADRADRMRRVGGRRSSRRSKPRTQTSRSEPYRG